MDLLNQIIGSRSTRTMHSSLPEETSPRGGAGSSPLLAMIIGALFAVAALQTTRAAPALQLERTELINRVKNAERDQDQLRGRVTSLSQEIAHAASRGPGR